MQIKNKIMVSGLALSLLASPLTGLDSNLEFDEKLSEVIIEQYCVPKSGILIYYIKDNSHFYLGSEAKTKYFLEELIEKKNVRLIVLEETRQKPLELNGYSNEFKNLVKSIEKENKNLDNLIKNICADIIPIIRVKRPAVKALYRLLNLMEKGNISTAALVMNEDESVIVNELRKINDKRNHEISYYAIEPHKYSGILR